MIMIVMMQKSRTILLLITFSALAASIGGYAATDVGGITVARGDHWSVMTSAALPEGTNAELLAVSCVTIRNCVAVGATNSSAYPDAALGGLELPAGDVPLIEQFDGRQWRIVPNPATRGALFGVSCTSSTFCVAVGYGTGQDADSIVEQYNGTSWQLVSSVSGGPAAANTRRLWSVSCTSSVFCIAVGSILDDHSINRLEIEVPSIDTLVGKSWSVAAPYPLLQLDLLSVSCITRTCLAVGSGPALPNGPRALSLVGGNWQTTATPPDVLAAVACPVAQSCLAVPFQGEARASGRIYHFDGRGWHARGTNVPPHAVALNGIACTDRVNCTLVGSSLPIGPSSTTRHAIVGTLGASSAVIDYLSIRTSGSGGTLAAVSCVQAHACIAVGTAGAIGLLNPRHSRTLAMIET
jgi:hypothetical protein